MDPEPKRPIEKMLEASAEARRAAFGAAPTMPNPIRARLHDEIARLECGESARSRGSWLQLFWPRLGVAAALATVLVIGSSIWWRGAHDSTRGGMQVADGRRPDRAPPNEAFAKGPAIVAAPAPSISLADSSRARLEPAQTPAAVASADSLSNQSTFSAPPNLATPAAMAKGLVNQSDKQLAARAAPSGAVTQQFHQQPNSQSFRNSVQSQRGLNVLNDFQLQQQGDEIRVVDSDGSTYTGQVERASELRAPPSARAKQASAEHVAEEAKKDTDQTRFRASGYNVSLKKSVTLEGKLSQTPMSQLKPSTPSAKGAEVQQAPARLVGTARIKDEPPVEVDAIAVGPEPAKGNQK